MSQHDIVIDNGPGLAVRTDINAALAALVSQSSGAVEPTAKFAGMLWLDTSVSPNGRMRQRNLANTAWVDLQTGTGNAIIARSYTSSGTWTKPTTGLPLLCIEVEIQAPGGAGGGAPVTAAAQGSAGGGGGGGGWCRAIIQAASLGATETITIGAVGAAGAAGANGGAGGTTTAFSISAPGGGGGAAGGPTGLMASVAGGPGGGAPTGGIMLWRPGDNGKVGIAFMSAAASMQGEGGGTMYGRGGAAALTAGAAGLGQPGYGGGGSGAANGPSTVARAGAGGAISIVTVVEYY
jgi:hypothetical protein